MVPVNQRIIQTHAKALCTHRVHKFAHQIAPAGGVCTLVVGQLGIKQAKTVVMLGCQHDILHPRLFCMSRPVSGVIVLRRKLLHVALILLCWNLRVAHIPFAARRNCVEPPVQEHAKARILKPLYPFFPFCHIRILSQRLCSTHRRTPYRRAACLWACPQLPAASIIPDRTMFARGVMRILPLFIRHRQKNKHGFSWKTINRLHSVSRFFAKSVFRDEFVLLSWKFVLDILHCGAIMMSKSIE